jgi:hypothetical protein
MTMGSERAGRLAARRNARLRAKYPLFADQLPEETAERVLREFEGYARKWPRAGHGCWPGPVSTGTGCRNW